LEGEPDTLSLTNDLGASLEGQALAYWKDAPLPYGHVQVPDEQIQALFDASIRNIWQAREIKSGLPAFQVGPTVYRSLWVVDGAFILEAAAMLGAGQEARAGIARELTYQKADGGIEVLKGVIAEGLEGKPWPQESGGSEDNFNYSKENGIALWTFLRHAQLTQDKSWLATVYPKMQQIAEHIRQLRLASFKNETSLDDGLIPPGLTDGGQNGFVPEYSNVLWNLVGLRSFVEAARWLGRDADAARWQAEYDDFLATFHRAAARDLKVDPYGNRYLPNRMDGADLPQRAQWAFMQAVYPGEVLAKDDPIVAGNLAMLKATLKEEMVYGSGWDEHGIWTYLSSFFAHALLWKGDHAAVVQQLYAFANHAAPTLAWREEQTLKEQPFSPTGDMPHNWASAEFIRLVIHMIELDRGKELHLLEALPSTWLKPNAFTSISKVATPFGPLTMSLIVSPDGKTANLHVEAVNDPSCAGIIVHSPGAGALVTLAPNVAHDLTLDVR
jgi:GH15 family glucan-1,4-alpha-glucosidase